MASWGAQGAPPCQPRTHLGIVRPRPIANVVLLLAVALLGGPLGFSLLPGGAPRAPGRGTSPWVSSSTSERLEVPRGEMEPRTMMRGKYETGTRSRKNHQGGGNLPINFNRKPCLAYSIDLNFDGAKQSGMGPADKGSTAATEPGGMVMRRAWDMYDLDYNRMAAIRQRYFRPDYRKKRWTADYNMRMGKRRKDLRIKRQFETEWLDWMRRNGKGMGLTEPIVYHGPKLREWAREREENFSEEEKKQTEGLMFKGQLRLEGLRAWKAGQVAYKKYLVDLKKRGFKNMLPDDMQPGQWNDDGPDNVFKIYARPLSKWPFDIGKRGRSHVVHGTVMGSRRA